MNALQADRYLIIISSFHSSASCSTPIQEEQTQPMLLLFLFLFLSIFLVCFLSISLYKKLKKTEEIVDESNAFNPKLSLPSALNKFQQTNQTSKPHSLFLEILNCINPPTKLSSLLSSHFSVGDNGEVSNDHLVDGSALDKNGGSDLVGDDCGNSGKKKKKKRGKKKQRNLQDENGVEVTTVGSGVSDLQHKHCLDCLYPFTSSSASQRKIKQQYDQLVKSNASKGLTMSQVGEFVNCLVEARNDLQHKSEIIQRKFTITKALLMKADRSSFDRLSQQLYKLEAEQKRLEEDAGVYNRLQQQLKLSPAYKKMLEIGARMELKASSELVKNTDTDFPDISFEELLAREKKDSFWQKNGKLRSCMN